MYRIRIESVTRRPQTSVRGKFLFHYSNDHKMSAYCSFFNILVLPPCCWPNFLYNFSQTFSCEDQFIMNIVCIRIVDPCRLMKSKTCNKGQCILRHYNKSNWLPFIQQPIYKKSGKGHMSLRARYLLLVSVPPSLTTCHSAECFLLSFIAKVGHFLQHPSQKGHSPKIKAKKHIKISFYTL